MWGIGTYYELLGVDPDAPPAVIRDAYRRAARAHHPDRHGDAAAARMAEVNAAWQTLRDPASRRAYDLSLRDPIGARSPSGSSSVPPVRMEPRFNPLARYQNPPRFPWGLMGVMAVVGTVAVIIGVATAPAAPPTTIDNLLAVGDCVAIEADTLAVERRCTDPHDGVVVEFLTADGPCPEGSEPHRDRQGLGIACVALR